MAYLSYATLREKYRRVFIYEENSIFMYVPLSTDRPLVQTETRSFQVFVIEPTATTSKLYWMLTARDFQKDGLVEISY